MKKVKVYGISNIGNVRDNHEDNLFVPQNQYIDEKKQKEIKNNKINIEYEYEGADGFFAVCDGMGGHNAGEVASRVAVETILKKYKDLLTDDKDKLIKFVKELNDYICSYSEKNVDCSNMGTTFSGLAISNDKIHLLHVGDSRIYKFDSGRIQQLSKDHTEGCRLVESGVIKKEDLLKFPNRKSLYKYLGRKVELIADCELINSSSRFIIASDGLSDTLSDDEIETVVSKCDEPKDVCHKLIDECLSKGQKCSDNVTIICIDIS
jgi:protein phosphatase